jgi:predicted dienelactone hydrolase
MPTSTSLAPPSTTKTTTTVRARFPVGSVGLSVTRAGRLFGVQVFYPGQPAGTQFPLIVFSPGYDIAPGVYDPLVTGWASLGFVVAVPDYPSTAPGAAGGVNEDDIVQHPGDLEATINRLAALARTSGSRLKGVIDPTRIAVAGHSDGGDVTDALASNSCCRDPRIRAAAVLSGAELSSFGGTYGPSRVPLLVVQGNADTINSPACSEQIYNRGGSPRFYLDLLGAGHLPPYIAEPAAAAYQRAVEQVTAWFWEAYLNKDAAALAQLEAARGFGSAAALREGGSVARTGACPGAP